MSGAVGKLVRQVWAVALLATAMAFLESAVVVYLREIWQIGDSLFPFDQALFEATKHIFVIEVGREAATLVILLTLAWAVARTRAQWWAVLLVAFGTWDIFYYVWLVACLGWPASLGTWDVLFLLPVQMTGPVYAPLSVSVLMIAGALLFLHCENTGRRVRFDVWVWALFAAGLAAILVSFYTNGVPSTGDKTEAELVYWWPLLVLGSGLGLVALLRATRELWSRAETQSSQRQEE